MYWSDVSINNVGLTLITQGLQGVSGGATRGLMLVREVTQDKEGLTDPGVHHLRYAYLPHAGTATHAQPWLYAYGFNQPLIVTWKKGQSINVQLPFDEETKLRALENSEPGSLLPPTFSLLVAHNAVVADLYRKGNQIEALVLNYNPASSATIQVDAEEITLPQSVFTLMQLSPSSLKIPLQK
jgi:hypothetical protein